MSVRCTLVTPSGPMTLRGLREPVWVRTGRQPGTDRDETTTAGFTVDTPDGALRAVDDMGVERTVPLSRSMLVSIARIPRRTPLLADTFTRTTASGWGTPDTGEAWLNTGTCDVTGGRGRQPAAAGSIGAALYNFYPPAFGVTTAAGLCVDELDMTVTDHWPGTTAGRRWWRLGGSSRARHPLSLGAVAVVVQVAGGIKTIGIEERRLGSAVTAAVTPTGVPPATAMRMRWVVVAGWVGVKAWADGGAEPAAWLIWRPFGAVFNASGSITIDVTNDSGTSATWEIDNLQLRRWHTQAVGQVQRWTGLVPPTGMPAEAHTALVSGVLLRVARSRSVSSPLRLTQPAIAGCVGHWSLEDGPDRVPVGGLFAPSPGLLSKIPGRVTQGSGTTNGRSTGIPGSAPVPVLGDRRVDFTATPSTGAQRMAVWVYLDAAEGWGAGELIILSDVRVGDGRRWVMGLRGDGRYIARAFDLDTGAADLDSVINTTPAGISLTGHLLFAVEWIVNGASQVSVSPFVVPPLGLTAGPVFTLSRPTNSPIRPSRLQVATQGAQGVAVGHVSIMHPTGSTALPFLFSGSSQMNGYRGDDPGTRLRRIAAEAGEAATQARELTTGRLAAAPVADVAGIVDSTDRVGTRLGEDRWSGRLIVRNTSPGIRPGSSDPFVVMTIPWGDIRRTAEAGVDVQDVASLVAVAGADGEQALALMDDHVPWDADAAGFTTATAPAGVGVQRRDVTVPAEAGDVLDSHAGWHLTRGAVTAPRLTSITVDTRSAGVTPGQGDAVSVLEPGDLVDVTGAPARLLDGRSVLRLLVTGRDDIHPRSGSVVTLLVEPGHRDVTATWMPASPTGTVWRWTPSPVALAGGVTAGATSLTLPGTSPPWPATSPAYPLRAVLAAPPVIGAAAAVPGTREVVQVTGASGGGLTLAVTRTAPVAHPPGVRLLVEDVGRWALRP